jgi:hypothetical protein
MCIMVRAGALGSEWVEKHHPLVGGHKSGAMEIPPDLLSATQNATVDRILQGVIALFELTLPSRVRSYYLEGSYAEGTATVASDIDLYVVLKEPLSAEETRVFWAVARSCHLLSSIPLDVFPLVEQEVLRSGSLGLKYASQILFGEDIRALIPDPSPEVSLHRAMHTPFEFMKRLRGASFLVYPLDYPDPASEFFGYEISRGFSVHNAHRNSLKELVVIICFTAASIVGYRSGRFVVTKSQAPQLYEQEVGDEWSVLIKSAFAIRDRWRYKLPKEAGERDELRALCQSTLHFEKGALADSYGSLGTLYVKNFK